MPPKNFRDNRPDRKLVQIMEAVEEFDLVRPCGHDPKDYKVMRVCLASADWRGPLYVAQESKRAGSRTFVHEYGYEIRASLHAKVDTPVFLGDRGQRALSGTRCVGVVIGDSSTDKGPIVHLAPGQCASAVCACKCGAATPPQAPAPRKTRRKKKAE